MKLTYIFHSGFAVEDEDLSILIDYFHDTNPETNKGYVHDHLLKRDKPLYILSSHFHPDHFSPEILKWKEQKQDINYIFSKDILKRKKAAAGDAFYIRKGESFRDDRIYIKAFGSTDVGISFYIETGGKKIFHAGDLNNWHWKDESTPEEIEEAENHYLEELGLLEKEIPSLNLAMFPVDARLGTDYMRGAEQFVDRIKTDLFVPMHFEPAYREAQAFKDYAEKRGCRFFLITDKGEQIKF